MPSVLLDTSVASFLHPKKRTSALRIAYDPDLRNQTLCLSFQSVAELYLWAERNRWGPARRKSLSCLFPVSSSSRTIAVLHGSGRGSWMRLERPGRRLEAGDTWIAATAVHRSI